MYLESYLQEFYYSIIYNSQKKKRNNLMLHEILSACKIALYKAYGYIYSLNQDWLHKL